ncbi:MAG: type II toxin-antitoxin system ParD family antitoxin [Candidatus Hydrogenedentota bacterium]
MPTQNVNLPEHQSSFIREMTEGGRYQNASEVVRAGLRLLEAQEEEQRLKLERLRAEVQKGVDAIESGDYITLENEKDIEDYFEGVRRRGRERLAREQNA